MTELLRYKQKSQVPTEEDLLPSPGETVSRGAGLARQIPRCGAGNTLPAPVGRCGEGQHERSLGTDMHPGGADLP